MSCRRDVDVRQEARGCFGRYINGALGILTPTVGPMAATLSHRRHSTCYHTYHKRHMRHLSWSSMPQASELDLNAQSTPQLRGFFPHGCESNERHQRRLPCVAGRIATVETSPLRYTTCATSTTGKRSGPDDHLQLDSSHKDGKGPVLICLTTSYSSVHCGTRPIWSRPELGGADHSIFTDTTTWSRE